MESEMDRDESPSDKAVARGSRRRGKTRRRDKSRWERESEVERSSKKRDLGKHHRKCDLSILDVVPQWDNIFVSTHAIDWFVDRYPGRITCMKTIIRIIKKCVVTGRRSDHSKTLLEEISPYVQFVSWVNRGRPVTLFMGDGNLCCLVARDLEQEDMLVVLTCFVAA